MKMDIERIKEGIKRIAQKFQGKDILAVGLFGSLARGDFHQKSDIDIFVITKRELTLKEQDELYFAFSELIPEFRKDVTVLVYDIESLKKIPTWQTLNLIKDAQFVFDKAEIEKIFREILLNIEKQGIFYDTEERGFKLIKSGRKFLHYAEKIKFNHKGIGLIYTIILIAILIIAVGVLGPYLFVRETYRKQDVETLDKIKTIRNAILGNPEVISKGLRSNFGYVGDMGGLPPLLEYLVLQQNPTPNPFPTVWNQTAWTVHSTGIGYGWRGPYIDSTYSGNYEYQAFKDAWGTKFQYIDSAGQTIINPSTVTFPVYIRSAGQDRIFGTSDDINENNQPELCRITENDVRAILRGYTYCDNGTPTQRTGMVVYWPSLSVTGTVTITSGNYNSNLSGPCPYQPAQTCYYFETPRIPIGIRKTELSTAPYINQFVVINGGGTLHDGSQGRMRWNFRGGPCGACISYTGRNTYRALYCFGVRSIVEIGIRNNCPNPVTITSFRLEYTYLRPIYFDVVFFSVDGTVPRDGVGWASDCYGEYGKSGQTYSLNFTGQFQGFGTWRWWTITSCTPTSFTIGGSQTGYISFGYFVDDYDNCIDIRSLAFKLYLSDGSVLDIPPQ